MKSYWFENPAATTVREDSCPEATDVVVVGAGLTGLVTAVLLARAGKQVVVLEAREVGDVTTGHTTGKLSLLQGTKLSTMLDYTSEKVARAYLEGNREGQAWLLRYCESAGIGVEIRDAATFASTPGERSSAEAEHHAAQRLGLTTSWVSEPDLGVPAYGAVVLRDQAQIDPAPILAALIAELTEHGGVVRMNSRVTEVSKVGRPTVRTDDGISVACDHVVLATGTPILDRGLYFAKVEARRSYVLMFTGVQPPETMLLSSGSPSYSVRSVSDPDGSRRLMVGGNGHGTGRTSSERRHLDGLRDWAAERFPGAVETHAWSAQDYSSHDGIPFVGKMPRGLGHIHVATGYDKWGLTNGVAAGLRIAGDILGQVPSWAGPMNRRVTRPRGALEIALINGKVGVELAKGLVPGTGDSTGCKAIGRCTHLGGQLRWNDVEDSWDCPLHGSRFSADGAVLEGPATRPVRSGSQKSGTNRP